MTGWYQRRLPKQVRPTWLTSAFTLMRDFLLAIYLIYTSKHLKQLARAVANPEEAVREPQAQNKQVSSTCTRRGVC